MVCQKGGAGKSNLAQNLAALAGVEGPAYILDRDPRQGTSSKWATRRGKGDSPPEWPVLIDDLGGATLAQAVARLRDKPGTLIIDTRPAVTEAEAEAAGASDLVLVPVRPTPNDLEAVGDTLAMVRKTGRPCGIVINAARTERRALEAYRALARWPVAVCPHYLGDRTVYHDAPADGLAAHEMRGPAANAAAAEMRAVWAWVKEISRG